MAFHRTKSVAALTLALMFAGPAMAGTVWNEAVDGDLSGNPLAPTAVSLASGANDVIGRAAGELDFVTFTVPTGYTLTSLTAVSLDFEDPTDAAFFIALERGPQVTVDVVSLVDATGLLGWQHVVPGVTNGTDILPAMGTSDFGATGFTVPLGAGQYSVWIQDDKPIDYDFRFAVNVPEPGTALLMLTALAALAGLRLHRRRT